MEFKVTTTIIFAFLVLAICAKSNAQDTGALGPVTGKPYCQIYQGILQSEAAKINTPDLPEDLKLQVAEVLLNAEAGCADCDGLIVWQNKICLVTNFRIALSQLKLIKAEADARAAATQVPTA